MELMPDGEKAETWTGRVLVNYSEPSAAIQGDQQFFVKQVLLEVDKLVCQHAYSTKDYTASRDIVWAVCSL